MTFTRKELISELRHWAGIDASERPTYGAQLLRAAADMLEQDGARSARYEDALQHVEWYQASSNSNPSCPYCGNQGHWGHDVECELADLLSKP